MHRCFVELLKVKGLDGADDGKRRTEMVCFVGDDGTRRMEESFFFFLLPSGVDGVAQLDVDFEKLFWAVGLGEHEASLQIELRKSNMLFISVEGVLLSGGMLSSSCSSSSDFKLTLHGKTEERGTIWPSLDFKALPAAALSLCACMALEGETGETGMTRLLRVVLFDVFSVITSEGEVGERGVVRPPFEPVLLDVDTLAVGRWVGGTAGRGGVTVAMVAFLAETLDGDLGGRGEVRITVLPQLPGFGRGERRFILLLLLFVSSALSSLLPTILF